MNAIEDWLRALDLKAGAGQEEIRQSWRDLVQVWHPDRFSGNQRLQLKAEEMLKRINDAYEHLRSMDPESLRATGGASRYEPGGQEQAAPSDMRAVLDEGVAAWNLWRKKYSNITPDLGGEDLAGRILEGVDFREARLVKVNLERADLYKANLSRALMSGARLAGADLNRALLIETRLKGADLSFVNLSSADLRGADLSEARIEGASLIGTRLEGADLSGVRALTAEQIETAIVDLETKLPGRL
jgi:curved DNA-binding protein CbpA